MDGIKAEEKKIKNTSDLTAGEPLRVLTIYAVPMLISMFFQQAYNLVDGWIAGKLIGTEALGAVGVCYPITVLLIAIASGLSLGTSIFCSQAFGRKDYETVKICTATSTAAYIPLAVLISCAGIALSPAILGFLNVPDEMYFITNAFLRIYITGFPFMFLYNISNGVLTGMGNSRLPLLFLIASSICNIILDICFVAVLEWGIKGLAWATVISQMLSAMLASVSVVRITGQIKTSRSLFSNDILKSVLKLGVPSMIQHVFMSFGQLAIQGVINGYGTVVIAGYSVAFRINGLAMNTLMAVSNALSGFIAQNKGAEKNDRIKQGIKICLIIAYSFTTVVVAALLIYGREIIALFLGETADREAVIATGMSFFRIVSPFYFLVCLKIVSDGALRGLNAMKEFMLATVTDNIFRICFGGIFSALWGLNGVWTIWPAAWIIGTSFSCIPLRRYIRELK